MKHFAQLLDACDAVGRMASEQRIGLLQAEDDRLDGRTIDYDRTELKQIYALGQQAPLVFLPSHKSNFDHLILNYLLWENDFPPNHTAGGINMNFFPVGPLLRRAGVFFIRRSFKDNELYKAVLRAYVDFLLERRFPLELWLVVMSALTLATALDNTGVSTLIAENIKHLLAGQSVYIAFIGVFLLTLILTELITNNAAAALTFPIAFSIAQGLGVSYLPFVLAVAFAASGSFISPYGYQTNLMVYNAGNYKLTDFIKFGIPVSLAYSAVVITLIPVFFPF